MDQFPLQSVLRFPIYIDLLAAKSTDLPVGIKLKF